MAAWIRRWTSKFEFSVITIIAFIAPIVGSIQYLITRNHGFLFSDHQLLGTILLETTTLLIIGYILYAREFDTRRFALNPSWRLTAEGLLLYIVTVLASSVAAQIVTVLYPAAGAHLSSLHQGNQNLITTLALSIINPLFEELLLVGYVITTLEILTTTTRALLASVSIRALCHFYQGPAGIAGIMVMGVIFGYIFIRKRQLWPLIVAHGIWDFLGLIAISKA